MQWIEIFYPELDTIEMRLVGFVVFWKDIRTCGLVRSLAEWYTFRAGAVRATRQDRTQHNCHAGATVEPSDADSVADGLPAAQLVREALAVKYLFERCGFYEPQTGSVRA